MRHLIYLLLASLLFCGTVWGQATDFQKKVNNRTITLDYAEITNDCTFVMALPENRGKGLPIIYIKAHGEEGTLDSLNVKYRPLFGISPTATDSLVGSDGAVIDMTWLKIYNGPSGAQVNFDSTIVPDSGDVFMCIMDFDGYPWRAIEFNVTHQDSPASASTDSIILEFILDVD